MSHGRYTDDIREDSLMRDDEERIREETEQEIIRGETSGDKGALYAGLFVTACVIIFLLWLFIG